MTENLLSVVQVNPASALPPRAGTRYNMLVHPEVSGNITANLRDVTMVEALDAVFVEVGVLRVAV